MIRTLLLAIAVAAIATSTAAAGVRVSGVDATKHPTLQLSVVTDVPSEAPPVVRENGHHVVGLEAQNLGRAKSVAVLLDRSQSMEGRPLGDAASAARAFVAQKPTGDRLAIVSFGRSAVQETRFSSATIDSDAALRNLKVDTRQGTALYDAVRLAALALASEALPGRVIVVLTDGDDTSSGASLARALAAAKHAGVVVFAIAIESGDFSPAPLRRLARESGGAYYAAASSSAVGAAYDAISRDLARTWRVSYLTAAQPGQSVRVGVTVPGHGSASANVRLAGESTAVEARKPSRFIPGFVQGNGVGALLIALIVGAAVLIAAALALATPRSTRLRRRLEPHVAAKVRTAERKPVRERFGAASGVFHATEHAFSRFKVWHRLHALLERADVPLRTVEFFYCMVLPGLGLGFLAAVAAAPTFAILIAMLIGGFAPLGILMFKARRRLNAIDDQLPDLLITMAASLKAGHSFRQAMQAVVSEGQPPLSDEFKRVLTETQLGRPMDDAMNEMGERLQSKNLAFVLTAVTIQRQVGGSLAGIFDMVADAVRQRQSFVRKIRSLTAMGRASAYTLVGLPFVLALLITLIRYEYVEPLYTTSTGHKMIAAGMVMMTLGSLFLRRIASFRG